MELVIEQEHIDAADRARNALKNPFANDLICICPIAQALISQGYEAVCVSALAHAKGHHWHIPEATTYFMAEWDQGFPVYPVTLELEEAL